eukprot:3159614-Rhodomonas_salina.1
MQNIIDSAAVPQVCQLTEKNRIPDNGIPFGALTHHWKSHQCQHHFQCLEPLLILDHTCLYEDTQNNVPVTHVNVFLVHQETGDLLYTS